MGENMGPSSASSAVAGEVRRGSRSIDCRGSGRVDITSTPFPVFRKTQRGTLIGRARTEATLSVPYLGRVAGR